MLLAQFHFTIALDILASTVTQKLKEKKKSDEFGHIKIENFFSTKDTIMRVKKTTYENQRKPIFVTYNYLKEHVM